MGRGGVDALANLDETGRQFIEMLQKRPAWETEWAEMNEHGQPLPNEMIVLSSMGAGQTFCFVPVVDREDNKKVVRMIVAPIITGDDIGDVIVGGNEAEQALSRSANKAGADTSPRLGLPRVFDEEGVDKNNVARSFFAMDIAKAWRDNGLVFNVELTEIEFEQKVSTRGGNAVTECLFDVIVYHSMGKYSPSWYNMMEKGVYAITHFQPSFSDPKTVVNEVSPNEMIGSYRLSMTSTDIANVGYNQAQMFFMELSPYLWSRVPHIAYIQDIRIIQRDLWTYDDSQNNSSDHTVYPSTPFPFAVYSDQKLPYAIEPQVAGKNYCVLGIIYFLRNYYGLPKMSQEGIAKDYINKLKPTVNGTSVDVEKQGMLTSDIIPYIELYFATFTGGISYSDVIQHHYLMLATLQSADESAGHAILVIGIDGNDVVYYDPLDGRQKKIGVSYVHGPYVVVSGVKK